MSNNNKKKSIGFLRIIEIIIALLVVIISICSLNQSCDSSRKSLENERKIIEIEKRSSYNQYALNVRPLIDVECNICSLRFNPKSLDFNEYPVKLDGYFLLMFTLKMVNKSDYRAAFRGHIYGLSNVKSDTLRNLVLSGTDSIETKYSLFMYEPYFEQSELSPSDSLVKYFALDSVKIDSLFRITLHYLLLYENELHCLYDTYSKNTFELKPLPGKMLSVPGDSIKYRYEFKVWRGGYTYSYPSSKLYSYDERNSVYKFFTDTIK